MTSWWFSFIKRFMERCLISFLAVYLVKDTRSLHSEIDENLYGYKKKRKGGGEKVSYDQIIIIRNKINIAKEIIEKQRKTIKTILPSNYAQLRKGRGGEEGRRRKQWSKLIYHSWIFQSYYQHYPHCIVLFPFFFFFFLSSIRKKEIGYKFSHAIHISLCMYVYIYILFSSKNN